MTLVVRFVSSHLRLAALQREVSGNRIESQILELESGDNSRRKLQNVVTRSTAHLHHGPLGRVEHVDAEGHIRADEFIHHVVGDIADFLLVARLRVAEQDRLELLGLLLRIERKSIDSGSGPVGFTPGNLSLGEPYGLCV
jgi:hypothetical protein